MKKAIACVLTLALLLSFAACGAGGGKDEPKPLAQDTDCMALHFDAPEGYASVARFVRQTADGGVAEKNIIYSFDDGRELTYAYAAKVDIAEQMKTEDLESGEFAGQTFFFYPDGDDYMSFAQVGEDVYGVQYTLPDSETREPLEQVLGQISFTDKTETDINDKDLYDVSYTIDPELPLAGWETNLTEATDGTVTKKSVTWDFGESADDLDFRFVIRVHKNTTIDQIIKADKEYEEKTIGELTYTVLKADEGKAPYEYFTQHGDDVYQIRNNGAPNIPMSFAGGEA